MDETFLTKTAMAVVSVGLLAGTPVLAADVLPPVPEIAQVSHAPIGAGWYLRGDIGYTGYNHPEATLVSPAGTTALPNENFSGGAYFGLGAGYRFNGWLRTDVTADMRFGSSATLFAGTPIVGAVGEAEFSSTALLANAYLDLGSWHGFTPYVGVGVGYAWNTLSDYRTGACPTPCVVGGTNLATLAGFPDATTGSFAYAFMAGVAVDAGRSLTLDLNYRYLNLGEAATGPVGTTRIETEAIDAHEVRFGVRWNFQNEAATVPLSRAF